jgi:hypothetical protein
VHPEYGSCNNGFLEHPENGRIRCMSCGGTGKSKPSVMGVYQIRMPSRHDDTTKDLPTPPAGFFAPDTTILDFLRNEIDKNKNNAMQILNLSSTTDAQGSETALGKMVDREDAFAMIMGISNQLFELFENTIKCLLDFRYGQDAPNYYPTVNYPKNFNIRSEAELTAEIATAKQFNLPEIAYRNMVIEFMSRRFSDNELDNKLLNIAFYTDRIIMLSSLEIAQKKASGSIANWEDILHTSIYQFIAEQMSIDVTFLDKTLEEQKTILVDIAKAKDAEINPNTGNVTQNILNNLAGGR